MLYYLKETEKNNGLTNTRNSNVDYNKIFNLHYYKTYKKHEIDSVFFKFVITWPYPLKI